MRLARNYVATEHFLLALTADNEKAAAKAMNARGISLTAIRQELEETPTRGARFCALAGAMSGPSTSSQA